jgi:hypothetical protein
LLQVFKLQVTRVGVMFPFRENPHLIACVEFPLALLYHSHITSSRTGGEPCITDYPGQE